MAKPVFLIIAGINGAGKTTLTRNLFRRRFSDFLTLNPDDITKQMLTQNIGLDLLQANLAAALETENRLQAALVNKANVAIETVLSTDKYKKYIRLAHDNGYVVVMVYVTLSSPELAIMRVADRVAADGHDVPKDKIQSRWQKSLDMLVELAGQIDELKIFNNDRPGGHPVPLAEKLGRALVIHNSEIMPDFIQKLVKSIQ